MVNLQKGFTLIELLVVIAIVSILSSILLVAIDPVAQTQKADDAKRLAMINQLQKALELYNLDHGQYPPRHVYTHGSQHDVSDFMSDLSPYMEIDLMDNLWQESNSVFWYSTHSDNDYQTYGLGIALLSPSNHHYEVNTNDGGYYNSLYEVGQNPRYCKNKYSGSDGTWWTYNSVCNGGD